MGFRFRQSVKLFPGLRFNFGKGGISLSAGVRGASVSLGSRGAYKNIGLPGTGLSYRSKLGGSQTRKRSGGLLENLVANAAFAILKPTPEIPKGETKLILALQDDGSVECRDEAGQRYSIGMAAYLLGGENIHQWLVNQCNIINETIESLISIHWDTPAPYEEIVYAPKPFDVKPPEELAPKPIDFVNRWVRAWREAIEKENAEAHKIYLSNVEEWNQKKIDFEKEEVERRNFIEVKRFTNIDSMQTFLSDVLGTIEWSHETSVNFEITDGGATIYLDVDLPEIENIPNKEASLAVRDIGLKMKEVSATQTRRNYMIHIHGIGFRLIGETFVALPTIQTVILSAYSQRLNKATGHVEDDYLYSVKVTRDTWAHINFANLKELDVVESLARFEIRRKMTKTGVFTPIEPFNRTA